MEYFYLFLAVLSTSASSITGGFYNKKHNNQEGSSSLYSFLVSLAGFLFWVASFFFDNSYDLNVIWYSLLFGGFFALFNVSFILAVKLGPITLTTLFSQLSLIGVTVWGFIFWGATPNLLTIIAIILVCVSLFLCLYKGKEENGAKFNFKWLLFAILVFVANTGGAIFKKLSNLILTVNTAFSL